MSPWVMQEVSLRLEQYKSNLKQLVSSSDQVSQEITVVCGSIVVVACRGRADQSSKLKL